MTLLLSDNIVSALGFTTEENFRNVKQGVCGLKFFADRYDLPEPFMASEINDVRLDTVFGEVSAEQSAKSSARSATESLTEQSARSVAEPLSEQPAKSSAESFPEQINYTKLEKAAIVSAADALKRADIDPSKADVLFILSTTKGNIFLLDENEREGYEPDQLYLWRSAELIARFFGNPNQPEVLSNACISGMSAIIEAQRKLWIGQHKYVVVIGVDVLSKFIVTGFQSFKALSQEVCKPFDKNRAGLNIGEAAATFVLTQRPKDELLSGDVVFTAGATRNDANHISGPSRTGEGAYLALRSVLKDAGVLYGTKPTGVLDVEKTIDFKDIAFINAHGTATPYNDDMESIALTRAGLQNVPVNSLKGYFGHTLGAAGILESIISTHAMREGIALQTYGFDTLGVTDPLDVVKETRTVTGRHFLKMLSGFGGCNIAALFTKYETK